MEREDAVFTSVLRWLLSLARRKARLVAEVAVAVLIVR
jgi:hypothetical protein